MINSDDKSNSNGIIPMDSQGKMQDKLNNVFLDLMTAYERLTSTTSQQMSEPTLHNEMPTVSNSDMKSSVVEDGTLFLPPEPAGNKAGAAGSSSDLDNLPFPFLFPDGSFPFNLSSLRHGTIPTSTDGSSSSNTAMPLILPANTSTHTTNETMAAHRGLQKKGSRKRKSRKKYSSLDKRWSNRFTWSEDAHGDFCRAVFEVGLKQSSPSAVVELIREKKNKSVEKTEEQDTDSSLYCQEHIKDNLMRYRAHNHFVRTGNSDNNVGSNSSNNEIYIEPWKLTAGEVAYLSFVNKKEQQNETSKSCNSLVTIGGDEMKKSNNKRAKISQRKEESSRPRQPFQWPKLTAAEERSPIGASFRILLGMYVSLQAQLATERSKRKLVNAGPPSSNESSCSSTSETSCLKSLTHAFVAGRKEGDKDDMLLVPSPLNRHGESKSTVSMDASVRLQTSIMKNNMRTQKQLQKKMRILMQNEIEKFPDTNTEMRNGHGPVGASGKAIRNKEQLAQVVGQKKVNSIITENDKLNPPEDGNADEEGSSCNVGIGSGMDWDTGDLDDEAVIKYLMS